MTEPVRYNAKDTSLTIGGVYITGYAEDSMLTWEKSEARGEFVYGAQGDAVFNETNNDLHTLTVTLMKTSPQFGYMLDLQNSREFFPVRGINKKLGISFGGDYGVIAEAPSLELGAEAGDAEFTIQVADGYTNRV